MDRRLVILVEFELRPDKVAEFRRLMLENATASLRDEPGCRQFDVLTPEGQGATIVLYEIYDDAAAFEAYLHARHYLEFAAAVKPLVTRKTVTRLGFVPPV